MEYSALWLDVQILCLIGYSLLRKTVHEETSSKCYDWSETYWPLLERKETSSFITDEDYVEMFFIYGLQDILEWIWCCIAGS